MYIPFLYSLGNKAMESTETKVSIVRESEPVSLIAKYNNSTTVAIAIWL